VGFSVGLYFLVIGKSEKKWCPKANFSIQTGLWLGFLFVKSRDTGQFIFLNFKQMLLLP